MKHQKFIISLIPVCLFNAIYFIWQPYNKHLLPIFPSEYPISNFLTNLIYYFFWLSLLVVISESCFSTDVVLSRKKRVIKKYITLFFIQIIGDLIKFIFLKICNDCFYGIFSPIFDSILFAIMLIVVAHKDTGLRKTKRYLLVSIVTIVLLVVILVYLNIRINSSFTYIEQKYANSGSIYLFEEKNKNFLCEFISMCFETIVFGIIYFVVYFSRNISIKYTKTQKRDRCVFVLRIFLVVLLLIMINIKALVIPKYFLQHTKISSTYSQSYVDSEFIDIDYNKIRLYRNPQELIFGASKYNVKYNNCVVQSFYQYDASYSEIDTVAFKYKHSLESFNIDGLDIKFYGDLFVTYVENGDFQIHFIKDIAKNEENSTLTKICKQMISNGDWNYFEWCAEYLLNYDYEFIMPYIEKYSNNIFTEYEKKLDCNSEINTNYIRNIAENLKNNYY